MVQIPSSIPPQGGAASGEAANPDGPAVGVETRGASQDFPAVLALQEGVVVAPDRAVEQTGDAATDAESPLSALLTPAGDGDVLPPPGNSAGNTLPPDGATGDRDRASAAQTAETPWPETEGTEGLPPFPPVNGRTPTVPANAIAFEEVSQREQGDDHPVPTPEEEGPHAAQLQTGLPLPTAFTPATLAEGQEVTDTHGDGGSAEVVSGRAQANARPGKLPLSTDARGLKAVVGTPVSGDVPVGGTATHAPVAPLMGSSGNMTARDTDPPLPTVLDQKPEAGGLALGDRLAEEVSRRLSVTPPPGAIASSLAQSNLQTEIGALASRGGVPDIDVPVGHRGWNHALGDRLMFMVGHKIQAAEIRLNPPDLGPIEVRVSIHNDQANVAFTAHHALTREALESAVPRLREMLGDQNLNLVNVDVGQRQAHQDARDRGPMYGGAGTGRNDTFPDDGGIAEDADRYPIRRIGRRGLVDHYV